MKQTLSMVVIAGTLTIIALSSCTKEDPVPDSNFVSPSSYPTPVFNPSTNLYLVANNWVRYGDQVYVNTFSGVLAGANVSGHTVRVYVEGNGKEEQISQRHITYMGNELWATSSGTDVIITYRCFTGMPFSSLTIRVTVS